MTTPAGTTTEWDYKHPRAQALLSENACRKIELSLIDDILAGEREFYGVSDYWNDRHDKLIALLAERDALKEELLGKCGEARICHALATARSENKFLLAERDALRSYIQELLADCEKWMETLSAKRLHALSKTDYEACLATIAKMRAFAAQEGP